MITPSSFSCSLLPWPPNPAYLAASFCFLCPLCILLSTLVHPSPPLPCTHSSNLPGVSSVLSPLEATAVVLHEEKKNHCLLLSETRVRGLKHSGDVTPGILTDFPEASRRPLLPSSAARLSCPLACSPVEQPLDLELLLPTHVWTVGFHPWGGPQKSRYFQL